MFSDHGITYKYLPCLDDGSFDIKKYFNEACKFVKDAIASSENKVLIHCFAGKSRAAAFTLAYLMKEEQMVLKDAFELLWTVRPIAAPNAGFCHQLKYYEMEVFGK